MEENQKLNLLDFKNPDAKNNLEKKIQCEFTSNRGGYCIYYLFYKTRQYSMNNITKNLNDKKINHFINSLYSPNNEKFDTEKINNNCSYNQICKKMYQNRIF